MARSVTTFQLILDVSRMCCCSKILQHLDGPCARKDIGEVCCGVSFGTARITNLDFADYAVIFEERTGVLAGALDSLREEAKPLGLRVSWVKTKVQAFGDIPDATFESIPMKGD